MASPLSSVDDLICKSANPFDQLNTRLGNFWDDHQAIAATVDSIHRPVLDQITQQLNRVRQDHASRSILMVGDSGSGKSHLLKRLRQSLNDQAYFAYIGPWVDSSSIWRHILRYTIDSLMQVPQGQSESQLLLWLKGLSAFTSRSLKQRVFDDSVWGLLQSDRRKFINHLKKDYKTANIHSSDLFFGVLHDLTVPERYELACEWLRGDDLSEDSMQDLRVKRCIETEDDAKNILTNISKIATDTQPIVLCFDNLDNIPKLEGGGQDFQALFNVNTIIHNDGLKNFLVIISIITNTWQRSRDKINPADTARIERPLAQLRQISLDQAEALWASQLTALHRSLPGEFASPIAPLTRQILEAKHPGGKVLPRNALILGREQYQAYKVGLLQTAAIPFPHTSPIPAVDPEPISKPVPKTDSETAPSVSASTVDLERDRRIAEFELKWQQERSRMQAKITKITLRSSPELIAMVLEAASALGVKKPRFKALSGKYGNASMQYKDPTTQQQVAVVWSEEASMTSFFHVMNACHKAVDQAYDQLYLLRAAAVGEGKLAGHQLYRQMFSQAPHRHVRPQLAAVQDLATYHSLVNAALAGELVVASQVLSLQDLQALVRQTQLLNTCQILQDLGLVPKSAAPEPTSTPSQTSNGKAPEIPPSKSPSSKSPSPDPPTPPIPPTPPTPPKSIQAVQDHILRTLAVQQFMGRAALLSNVAEQFSHLSPAELETAMQQACQSPRVSIMNPQDTLAEQLICWVPN